MPSRVAGIATAIVLTISIATALIPGCFIISPFHFMMLLESELGGDMLQQIIWGTTIGPWGTGPGSAAIPTAASCPAVHAGSGAAAPGSAPHATIPDPGPGSSSSRPPASFQIAGIAITSARPASASRAGRFRRAPRRGAGRGPAQDRRRRPGMT